MCIMMYRHAFVMFATKQTTSSITSRNKAMSRLIPKIITIQLRAQKESLKAPAERLKLKGGRREARWKELSVDLVVMPI